MDGFISSAESRNHHRWGHRTSAPRRIGGAICVVVLVVVGAGCGSSDSDADPAPSKPAQKAAVSFSGLPKYAGSIPVGDPTDSGPVTAQTFTVDNASPRQILDFYAGRLSDWNVVEEPHALTEGSRSAWRGRWQSGGSVTLAVSAKGLPTSDQAQAQYSLNLRAG